MIVIEREALARWIRELKLRQTLDDGVDYYTAYLSALTAVEAYMAMMPEYDLGKVIEDAVKRAEERERYEMDDLAMGF
jgi:hypothetical protein